MAQKKGQTGNPNGRPKGTPNKTTAEMKETIQLFIELNFEQIQKDFAILEPRERVTLYERMLKYVIPSKVEQEIINIEDDKPSINISIGGKDLSLNK
jgi:hypothetical protein